MNSIIEQNDREDFYIRLYFNIEKRGGYQLAGIKRAFLDFSRTLSKKDERLSNIKKAEDFILHKLSELLILKMKNQDEFDVFHENICIGLKENWEEIKIGQAQKWVNMTLKYWLLFGESRISGIENNAKYFHIPIDRFIQNKFFGKNLSPWSQIEIYKDYFIYQKKFRENFPNEIPIAIEFREFNKLYK